MPRFLKNRTSPDANRITQIYDARASTWLQRESRAETRLVSEEWRNDWIHHLHGDVLELGVAAGDTLVRLRHTSHDVRSYTGIDLSPAMIRQARQAGEGAAFPVRLLPMDAEQMATFADGSFDTVAASLVLCTIPDVPRALAEIARVLRPHGRLVLIEHVLSPNILIRAGQKLAAPLQCRLMGCHLDRTTVETLVAHGYQIEQHRRRLFDVMRFVIAVPPN